MKPAHILVVDDEIAIRDLVGDILRDEGYEVSLAEHAQAARDARRARRPDVILLDIWMPDTDGVALLREWHGNGGVGCPVIMMSGHGTIETAVEATRLGAYDYIEKPISLAKLLITVKRALEGERLRHENAGLKQQLAGSVDAFAALDVFGQSSAMMALKAQCERMASHDAPVLIRGESGSGREAIARWLHAQGSRRNGPFIRINAIDLADSGVASLCGSEGNGHVQYGVLDRAQGGVLFLDEVADFPREAQRALAQVLEARAFTRVGARTGVTLDCRVMASVGSGFEAMIQSGKLLDTLYFQLNVLGLSVPPLRDRAEDLPRLLEYHQQQLCLRDGVAARTFSAAALKRLLQYNWPGNSRELRNLVQRLLILGGGDIDAAEIELAINPSLVSALPSPAVGDQWQPDLHKPLREARDEFERRYLTEQLKRSDGSVGKLAQLSGMERTHLYRKLRDLGVEVKS